MSFGRNLAGLLLVGVLSSGCIESLNQQAEAERLSKEKARAEFVGKFDSANVCTGKVFSSVVSGNGESASIIIKGTKDTIRFDYRNQGGFGLSDRGLTYLPLEYPNGSKVCWKEGYRPHDLPKPTENGIYADFTASYVGVR